MDLSTYTDEDLDTLRLDVINEQERRQRLASIPTAIADLVNRYVEDGGSKEDLSI